MSEEHEPRRDFSIPLPVLVRIGDGEGRVEYALNASPSGLCLQFRTAPDEGTILELAFEVPPEGPEVQCRGEVIWLQAQDGSGRLCEAGVRLIDLADDAATALDAFARMPIDRRR